MECPLDLREPALGNVVYYLLKTLNQNFFDRAFLGPKSKNIYFDHKKKIRQAQFQLASSVQVEVRLALSEI